jgi:uncharacterized membrane protein
MHEFKRIVSGLVSAIVGIYGTKESAGFGFIGMVGPINAFKFMQTCMNLNALIGPTIPIKPKPADSFVP